MVSFQVRFYPEDRIAYFPKAIAGIIGKRAKAIPNENTILLYRSRAKPEDVIASLRVIEQILTLQAKNKRSKTREA